MSAEGFEHDKLGEELNERELGLQCQEPARQDEQSKVIDGQNGCGDEHQDGEIGQWIQEITVFDLADRKLQLGEHYFCSYGEGNCKETKERGVEVTEEEVELGEESRGVKEDSFVNEYLNDSPEPQYEGKDEVSGEESRNQMRVVEVIGAEQTCKVQNEVSEQDRVYALQSQEPIQADRQLGLGDELQGEVIEQEVQEISVVIEEQDTVEERCSTEEQVGVSEWLQYGKQSQESVQEEQDNLVIDYEDGSREKQIEQQDLVIVENYNVEEHTSEGENRPHSQEEQNTIMIDDVNVCPDEQQGEVIGLQVQNQMEEITSIEQNLLVQKYEVTEQQREDGQQSQEPIQEVQKYKVSEAQVQVTEQQMEYARPSREPIQQEHDCKMAADEIGFPSEQQGEVSGYDIHIQCQEVIVENQNVPVEKYKVTEEQVELNEQQTEHGQKNQVLIQEQNSVIDYQNGSSKPENEQKDEVNVKESRSQILVTAEIVNNYDVAEPAHVVTEQQVVVTEQQRDHGQQSQEEQNSKMIDCKGGIPKQQDEQLDDVNGSQVQNQMQDIVVSVENQVDAQLKCKAAEDQMEEQCRSTEQQCEVTVEHIEGTKRQVQFQEVVEGIDELTRPESQQVENVKSHGKEHQCEVTEEHIEGIKRQIQFQEEVIEGIDKLTRPEAQQVVNVSELQKQMELLSNILNAGMQESFPQKKEKAAVVTVNSTPLLTGQKLPYHSSSTLSRENCLELLRITHKLQEKTHKVQESLLDLLTTRELSPTSPKSFIELEESTRPIAGFCGEREYIDSGVPAQMKQHQPRQLRPRGEKASESDCRVSKEPNSQDRQQRDPVLEKSKKRVREVVELSCQTRQRTREPAQQRQLRPRGQSQSNSELSLTTSLVVSMVSSPRRNQDTQLLTTRATEKPKKVKRSAEETGQTRLQQRQLRPRGKSLSESKQATPEACEDVGPTIMDKLSQPVVQITDHDGQQKMSKSNPKKMAESPQLNSASVEDLPRTAKEPQQKRLCNRNLRSCSPAASQSGVVVLMEKSLPSQHLYEQTQEMKCQGRFKVDTHNQHNGELKPPKHPEEQQKRRGRSSKRQVDVAANEDVSLPADEVQPPKHPEQPQKPGVRAPKRKLDAAATEDVILPADEVQPAKHPEQSQKRSGRLQKLNANNELVKNCSTPRNRSSHKWEEELQLPKQPEQTQSPKRRRGRSSKLISENELKQEKSQSERRQSQRLKQQK